MDQDATKTKETRRVSRGWYVPVKGLRLYYEIHGSGRPLALLHGGFMTINEFGPLLPVVARFLDAAMPEVR
jgi:pimeloyl-ACP methyl ester carboxylesterase